MCGGRYLKLCQVTTRQGTTVGSRSAGAAWVLPAGYKDGRSQHVAAFVLDISSPYLLFLRIYAFISMDASYLCLHVYGYLVPRPAQKTADPRSNRDKTAWLVFRIQAFGKSPLLNFTCPLLKGRNYCTMAEQLHRGTCKSSYKSANVVAGPTLRPDEPIKQRQKCNVTTLVSFFCGWVSSIEP